MTGVAYAILRHPKSHVAFTLKQTSDFTLQGLFHPACLARVVSWFAFVVAIFMAHENGDKQRLAKRRHVQGMLDETDPLIKPTVSWCRLLNMNLVISD